MGENRHRVSTVTSKGARLSRNARAEEKRGAPPDPRAFLKKCLFIAVIIIVAGVYLTAFMRKAEDKADPHTRSFTEFSEVFNERMATQGIAVGEDTQWDTSTTWYETTYCVLTLPDGGEIPCHIELWGYSLRQTPIMSVEIRFTSEQEEYLIPIVQGVFDVFEPELDGQVLPEIIEFCKSCFGQEAYEKKWNDLPHGYFYLTSDAPDAVTAKWFFLD